MLSPKLFVRTVVCERVELFGYCRKLRYFCINIFEIFKRHLQFFTTLYAITIYYDTCVIQTVVPLSIRFNFNKFYNMNWCLIEVLCIWCGLSNFSILFVIHLYLNLNILDQLFTNFEMSFIFCDNCVYCILYCSYCSRIYSWIILLYVLE